MEEEKHVVTQETEITAKSIEEYNETVGMQLRVSGVFNQTVSYEAIRNYVYGIGDTNPLYLDKEYAAKTRYGTLIAPPGWLYSVFPTWIAQGMGGTHGWHSGNDWEFYKPIYVNDHITPKCTNIGLDVIKTEFAGRSIWRYQKAEYFNQQGELVAKANAWSLLGERQTTRKRGKYSNIELPHPWKEEDLKKIEEGVLAEKERGSTVRYWDDVQVGEDLPPVTKGPLGLTDMIAYCVGASPILIAAHKVMLQNYHKHPAWAFRDPETCALEPLYAVHYNKSAAQAAGLPYPYDVGTQRQGWFISFITSWMGDEGWIKRNYAEYHKFVYFSDAVTFKGKVTKKYIDENGECCVDIVAHGVNQRNEDTIPGFSTIILPSREKKTWPLAKRLPAKRGNPVQN